MTQIRSERPLVRESAVFYRGRALMVRLFPGYIELRPKGTRQAFAIEYRAVYEAAMKLAARQATAERSAKKSSRKRPKIDF